METKHLAELEAAIDEWVDKISNNYSMPVIGQRTVALMATAAATVFEAIEESQEHAKAQNLLVDPSEVETATT